MHRPPILQLDISGQPRKWISYEKAAYYYCKQLVAWEAGSNEITIYGGVNRIHGHRSALSMNSIIAIRGNVSTANRAPTLSNKVLFRRDGNICTYCGNKFTNAELTRDHIHPRKHGGPNKWSNVITACKSCNNYKGDSLLADIGLQLRYQPYVPTTAEHLFFSNASVLDDQYDFLMKYVSKQSRIPILYPKKGTTND